MRKGSSDEIIAARILSDPLLRLENLYYIINADGQRVKFKMNDCQRQFYCNRWNYNVILKARQLGFSTMISLHFLNKILFQSHVSAGIIAHTQKDAQKLFRRIKFAYENLPKALKDIRKLEGDNAGELILNNGSSISVGTSLRSSSNQLLHVSEFGYICANQPQKADEIMKGSLNTVQAGGEIFIESTAEGSAGHFYDICERSRLLLRKKVPLTSLDYRFHFFSWWQDPKYILDQWVEESKDDIEYFNGLESEGILLSGPQRAWYIKKKETQGDAMFSEFPSTPDEAFRASASGIFYGKDLATLRIEKRLTRIPYSPMLPLYTVWDLAHGVSGYTCAWFFQIDGEKIKIVDFYQGSGSSLSEHISFVKQKGYPIELGIFPHDVEHTESILGLTRNEVIQKLGIDVIVCDKLLISEGIEAVHDIFPRLYIDADKCEEGIRMIENYRREWDARLAKWSHKPVGDINSHAADALRMLAIGIRKLDNDNGELKNEKAALETYWGTRRSRNANPLFN